MTRTSPSATSDGPPTQLVAAHSSSVVHALPSSHDAVFAAFTQPVAVSQESSVQTLLSSQSGAGPPTQSPPEHTSAVVHASLSSHCASFSGRAWRFSG